MSLIRAIKVGLWNAWILVLSTVLISIVGDVFLKRRETYESKKESAQLTKKERILSRITSFLFLFMVFFSVFLPLKLGTAWFYFGFLVYLLGTVFFILANLTFATTPVDKPVTEGVYRLSRHPMNFGFFLIFTGTGIACASWIFMLCGMVFITLMHLWVPSEERWSLEKYGDAYREYMNRTPRWIGIPKSEKKG